MSPKSPARLGVKPGSEALALVLKTLHTAHGGKMSIARMLAGQVGDGITLQYADGEAGRVAGVFKLIGQHSEKRGRGRRPAKPSPSASSTTPRPATRFPPASRRTPSLVEVKPYAPVLAIAVHAKERKDDVKLGQAFTKLTEEDPSITVVHNAGEPRRGDLGAGRNASARRDRTARRPLRRAGDDAAADGRLSRDHQEADQQRGRHKKQSGGHGQFGDVVLEIKPLPRGSGFKFEEKITGGVVPRNYIPSVEEGVIDALKHGPLGFPVVDLAVTLVDGSYHTVDSSDMAFRTAGRIGIVEGLPQCQPVLLEPIHLVEIVCPSEATAKINAILSGRRGQILGFDTREGWPGWDMVRAQMAEAEIGDLIIEVRSATAGVGSFTFKFDHMAELTGRTADQIVAARRAAE